MTYHYHSQVLNATADKDNAVGANATGKPYVFNVGGVYKCWRGNISISNFFNLNGPFLARKDLNQLKPCCNSTDYYVATGLSLPLTSSAVVSATSPSAPPTGSSHSGFCGDGVCDSKESPTTCAPDCSSSLPTKSLTNSPIRSPTYSPAQAMSLSPAASYPYYLNFQTTVSLTGASSSSLDVGSQNAIIFATAQSMNIYYQYISYLKSIQMKIRHTAGTVSVTVLLQIQYPISNSAIVDATYNQLTNNLITSHSTGIFDSNLQAASSTFQAQVIQGSSVTGVAPSTYTVVTSSSAPSLGPSASPPSGSSSSLSTGVIIGVAVGGAVLLICVIVFALYFLCGHSKEVSVGSHKGSQKVSTLAPSFEETYPHASYEDYRTR